MICEVSKVGAEVMWYHGDGELPELGRYEQIMDGRKRILIIQNLRMDDAGEYNCRLSPTIKTSATLKVKGEESKISHCILITHQESGNENITQKDISCFF